MKFILFSLCLSAFYLKGISGGVVPNVELTIEKMTANIEQELNDLVEPILTGAKKIEDRFIAYQIRQSEIETFSLLNLNFSACMEFGSTLENSTPLAYNISTTAYEIVKNVSNSINSLRSHCFNWDPYEAVQCYINNFATIKEEIENIIPLIQFYQNIVTKLALKVEDQFFTCIGDAPQPQPTDAPTAKPTAAPTNTPTEAPTPKSTESPTPKSTEAPTPKSTEAPTPKSTEAPTPKSTEAPTPKSTEAPTPKSTEAPTPKSTEAPTPKSTEAPTPKSTEVPVTKSTKAPTSKPTNASTAKPTTSPTTPTPVTTTSKPWWHF